VAANQSNLLHVQKYVYCPDMPSPSFPGIGPGCSRWWHLCLFWIIKVNISKIFIDKSFSLFQDFQPSAGILEQSMGSRNRVRIGLSNRPARLHRLAESIPWNEIDSLESIPGLLNSLNIWALFEILSSLPFLPRISEEFWSWIFDVPFLLLVVRLQMGLTFPPQGNLENVLLLEQFFSFGAQYFM